MTIIYEDDIYPEDLLDQNVTRRKKYEGKTIKQILEEHPDPSKFVSQFNKSNKYCLSDEVAVNRTHYGNFRRNWQRN